MGSRVGPNRKTVPYVTAEDRRGQPFTRELELASLFIIANTLGKREPPSSMARVYYPLHIHSWEGGALLIDLLDLNHASIRYNLIPDVEAFERELDAVADDPEALRKALEKRAALFKGFAGHKTVRIRGLLAQPNLEKLEEFLGEMSVFVDEAIIFKPALKSRDIEAIIDSIYFLRDDIKRDLKSLKTTKRSLRSALGTTKRVVKGEIKDIRDRGADVKARMRVELEEIKSRLLRSLDLELNRIRAEYRRRVTPLRGERRKLRRRLDRVKKKLENIVADDPVAGEDLKKEIGELDIKLEEIERTIRFLMARRDTEVTNARARYKADLQTEVDKIKEAEARSREEILEKQKGVSGLEEAAKGIASKVNALIRSKRDKLRSLSRFCLDIGAETADLYIPFYLFQYGKRAFNLYPPAVASSSRGLLSRFRRMLADNLQSKMTQLLRPRAEFLGRYLKKAVSALGRKTSLATAYRRVSESLNLLQSRETVDKIMLGLVRIRREGWISDSEYIRIQEALVESLGLISRP